MSGGVYFSMENLPERYRAQVAQQLAGKAGKQIVRPESLKGVEGGFCREKHKAAKKVRGPIRMHKDDGGPNQTEGQFNRDILLGGGLYESLTLHLSGGVKYTPDWLWQKDGEIYLVEIKGSYRLPTHGRSVMAFKTACAEFPMFVFMFAELGKDGRTWTIGVYKAGKEVTVVKGTATELHNMQ